MNSTASVSRPPLLPRFSRNAVIVSSVLVFHGLAIWALQSGLVRKAIEVVVPVEMLSEFIEAPKPKEAPPTPPPAPIKQPVVKTKAPALPPAPQPLAIADPTPSPNAPTGVTTPQPPAPPVAVPVAVAPPAPPAAPPAPPRIELPSTDADYLQNPKPVYPRLSKTLGEQGQVIHSVLIGVDGHPISATLVKSSGYDRLDQAAYKAVMAWRYIPGKRNGVVAQMSYNAPINWVLE